MAKKKAKRASKKNPKPAKKTCGVEGRSFDVQSFFGQDIVRDVGREPLLSLVRETAVFFEDMPAEIDCKAKMVWKDFPHPTIRKGSFSIGGFWLAGRLQMYVYYTHEVEGFMARAGKVDINLAVVETADGVMIVPTDDTMPAAGGRAVVGGIDMGKVTRVEWDALGPKVYYRP